MADQRRHGVGLDGVVEFDGRGQSGFEFAHPFAQELTVVGVKRRAADAGRQSCERDATDEQLAIANRELVHGCMDGRCLGCVHRGH